MPSKPCRATPTIVYGWPLMTVVPDDARIGGEAAATRSAWLSTATGCPPGTRSSSSAIVRPSGSADAEDGEVVAGDELTGDAFRSVRPRRCETPCRTGEDALEDLIVVADLLVHRVRQLDAVAPVVAVAGAR